MSGKMTGMSKVVAIAPQSQWPPPYDSRQWKWPPFPSPCADLCRRCEREKTPCCPTAAQRAKSRRPKPWNPCHLLILQIHDHTWQQHISARDHQTSLTKRMELVLRCFVMMCWTLSCKQYWKLWPKRFHDCSFVPVLSSIDYMLSHKQNYLNGCLGKSRT